MKRVTLVVLLFSLFVSSTNLVRAHHALEYIDLESTTLARPGEFLFHVHYDYLVDDADNPNLDHWEFTPGVAFGLHNRVMVDIHTHFARFGLDHVVAEERDDYYPSGPSPFMEAVAASIQVRVVDDWLVNVGLSGTIEIPFARAEELLGSEDNVYAIALILGREFGEHKNLMANIFYEQEGEEDETTWAIGFKTPLSADSHGIAAGLEVFGDFEGKSWSVMPGVYAPLSAEGVIFKTGIQIGQEKVNDDVCLDTIRASVALMFRF